MPRTAEEIWKACGLDRYSEFMKGGPVVKLQPMATRDNDDGSSVAKTVRGDPRCEETDTA